VGFFDSDGIALIIFAPAATDSGYHGSVQISTAGRALPNLDFLILLGWYALVSKYLDEIFKSAMIIATACDMG
jgi:hypothetical protein